MEENKVTIRGELSVDGYLKVKKVIIAPEGTYVEDEYNTTCLAPQKITVRLGKWAGRGRPEVAFDELLEVYKEHTA